MRPDIAVRVVMSTMTVQEALDTVRRAPQPSRELSLLKRLGFRRIELRQARPMRPMLVSSRGGAPRDRL